LGASVQHRSAVGVPVFEVELMRELVKNNVLTVAWIGRAVTRRVPRQYERAKCTGGVAEAVLGSFFPDTAADVTLAILGVAGRIDENLRQLRVVIGVAMQQEQASLSGDGDADLISQLQPAAAFEVFLGKEDLDVAEELGAIVSRETPKDREVAIKNGEPCRRKWLGTQLLATSLVEETKDHERNLVRPHRLKRRLFDGSVRWPPRHRGTENCGIFILTATTTTAGHHVEERVQFPLNQL